MKKRYLTASLISLIIGSMTLTGCIGSFRLTGSVLKWNNQIGSKFVNELVFFAFWVLPVYEVTSLADLLVINSIEFWSGRNPLSASTKVIDTDQGKYSIVCDGKGYTVTHIPTGRDYRLDFAEQTQTWSLQYDGHEYPLMTFVDHDTVKMIGPDGQDRIVDLTPEGVLAYENEVSGRTFLTASVF